jgi:hypothetical protein
MLAALDAIREGGSVAEIEERLMAANPRLFPRRELAARIVGEAIREFCR